MPELVYVLTSAEIELVRIVGVIVLIGVLVSAMMLALADSEGGEDPLDHG